jgi:hypothetical protein
MRLHFVYKWPKTLYGDCHSRIIKTTKETSNGGARHEHGCWQIVLDRPHQRDRFKPPVLASAVHGPSADLLKGIATAGASCVGIAL